MGRIESDRSRGIYGVAIGAEERTGGNEVVGKVGVVANIAGDRVGFEGKAEVAGVGAGGSKGTSIRKGKGTAW